MRVELPVFEQQGQLKGLATPQHQLSGGQALGVVGLQVLPQLQVNMPESQA